MRITYLSHSGFLVELETAYLLFDYYKGDLPELNTGKKFYVFVSHAHYDHFKKDIFKLREYLPDVYFILSNDAEPDGGGDVMHIGPNEERNLDGCKIRTLRSTDEGVAFLVEYDGRILYHAGDLNWWHWEEESKAYNTMMRRNYQHEINKLHGVRIDVAFVPVDPRLGEQYYWGLDCFMKRTETRAVFPMENMQIKYTGLKKKDRCLNWKKADRSSKGSVRNSMQQEKPSKGRQIRRTD